MFKRVDASWCSALGGKTWEDEAMLNSTALWIEDLDSAAALDSATTNIEAMGANTVCIRTSSSLLEHLIPKFHEKGIRVYGWRWAAVVPHAARHAFAKDEADFVAAKLIPAGLDGYIFDVESDEKRSAHDWDRTDVGDLKQLAKYYTDTIKMASIKAGRPFLLGLTSHAKAFTNYPKIPWGPFVAASDVLFPQTYWRCYEDKTHSCKDANQGTPDSAINIGYTDYSPKSKAIIPVAGELRCSTANEITALGKVLETKKLIDGHFYVNSSNIKSDVLSAIKALSPKSAAATSIS
jgi:hypothetical protein